MAWSTPGLVSLDDPVDKWLPELADRRALRRVDGPLDDSVCAARPVTVRDLLTFTFGFGMDGAGCTRRGRQSSEASPPRRASSWLGSIGGTTKAAHR